MERRVTWLELFFDLVFVVLLSRMAHDLARHASVNGVANFAILFAAVFWAWNAFTFYVERFESGGLENRFFLFAAMAAASAMAVWTEAGLRSHYTGFAITYVATRAVNMAQWTRAAWHVPIFRPVGARFVSGFLVTATLVVVAIGLDGGTRRVVFAVAVFVDIATPMFTLRQQAKLPQVSTSKFPERFGLFTILVLGESVVGVINGVSEINAQGRLSAQPLVNGGLGLIVGIGLWWVYFDFIARRPPKPKLSATLGWVYLHLASLAAITATGAAISVAIAQSVEGQLTDAARYLLGGSAAAALVGFAALELTLRRADGEPTHPTISPALKAGGGLVLLIATAIDLGWTATTLLGLICVCLAVPAVYGAIVWFSPTNTHRHIEQEGNYDGSSRSRV